jgi:PKD repeat protein
MYKKFLILFLLLINVGFASAALSWGEWTANHNTDITINNGQLSEFEWTVQAVSSFQGIQGKYSIWLFRDGNNNPIKTYFSNQPTINNGAGGYINVTPTDYQNLIGDYQVKIYSSDYFGADTHIINLHVNPAQNPLTVSCSANPTQGQAPLTTAYTATVSGGSGIYNSYFWNFNDGQTQTTSTNATLHAYQNAGTYNGLITVTDNQGHTATANCPQITVTPPPVPLSATCNANPTSGYAPLNVNFYGRATGGSGTYYYYWQFDDGHSQYGNNETTHTYQQNGTFHPTLKVTDTNNDAIVVNCPTIHANNYPPITGTCTANPTNGTKPLTVQFHITAQGGSGTYNSYGWDFLGNNQLDTRGNTTSYTYQNAGTYNPDVTVYDNQGHQGTINCPTIKVNEQPQEPLTATCNVNPTNGNKPLNVILYGKVNGGSGTYYYYWFFDDGYSKYAQNETMHTYTQIGTFHPTLKVTDSQNHITTVNCPKITVTNCEPITGTCIVNPTNGYAPLNVNITINAKGGSGTYTSYKYIFGDGQTTTNGPNILHTYQNTGYYWPKTIITDNNGNTGIINCEKITVQEQPIINYTLSCAANPTSGYAPLKVNFNATITTSKNNDVPSASWTYTWVFSDGTSLINGPNVQHNYNSGTFHPTVRATNGNVTLVKNCPTITATIPLPTPFECKADPTSGYAPLEVKFWTVSAGTATNYTKYVWTFDDGTLTQTNTGETKHDYANPRIYNPKVTGTDNYGQTYTATCPTIRVNEIPQPTLTATCDANPTSGNKPLNVNFYGRATGGSGTYYYYWQFDDGHSQYGNNETTHTYQQNGTFHPTLKVTDSQNHITTVNCPTINVYEQPIINQTLTCNANPTNGYEPLNVNFNAEITQTINGYEATDYEINKYIAESDAACNDGSTTWIYKWIFDDGQTLINGQNVQHIYNKGTYYPLVQATKGCTTLTAECPTITVSQYVYPNITGTCVAEPDNGNAPLTAELTVDVYGGSGIYTDYAWNFDDGKYQNTIENSILHTYYDIGSYNPSVVVTDNKGNTGKIICDNVEVTGYVPDLECIADPTYGNAPLDVTFNAVTKYMTGVLKPGSDFVSYEWTFGDGQIQTTIIGTVDNTYNYARRYYPLLKGIRENGEAVYANCPTITVSLGNYTLIADPNGPYREYINTQIMFDGSGSQGDIVKYVWDFGDGKMFESTLPYAYHAYNNTVGIFPVKLTVYDIYGHSAVGYTAATIIEPTNFLPDKERIKDGLWIGKIIMTGNEGIQEVARSNDDVYFNIELANDYEYDIDEARIIIEIQELGIKQKSTAFDLRTGQEKSQSIIVPIWDVPEGWYSVKITVQDDNVRRVKYRELYVSNTYRWGCTTNCVGTVY